MNGGNGISDIVIFIIVFYAISSFHLNILINIESIKVPIKACCSIQASLPDGNLNLRSVCKLVGLVIFQQEYFAKSFLLNNNTQDL